jgi:sirohydrochlorin cobaltochelatase
MIEQLLQERLRAGAIRLGELIVRQAEPAGYVVRHWQDDQPEQKLTVKTGSIAALEIVRYDAEMNYRPLKGAPNLRTGWELRLDSIAEVRHTIDYFYPGAFATWLAYNRGEVTPVDLRQTLARQTGMYRVTQKLSDSQAEELAGRFCQSRSGCLRTILWTVDGKAPNRYLPSSKFDPQADQLAERREENVWIPFLCAEACNLFVAEARKIVKVHST